MPHGSRSRAAETSAGAGRAGIDPRRCGIALIAGGPLRSCRRIADIVAERRRRRMPAERTARRPPAGRAVRTNTEIRFRPPPPTVDFAQMRIAPFKRPHLRAPAMAASRNRKNPWTDYSLGEYGSGTTASRTSLYVQAAVLGLAAFSRNDVPVDRDSRKDRKTSCPDRRTAMHSCVYSA